MGRSPCCDKDGLKKGPWTPEEDLKLVDYIQKHGYGNWRTLPKNAGLQRCGKSCRLRWTNYLRPDIKRGRFSSEEEEFIIQLHAMLGNKWSAIAAQLPGRTDNEIKNYWNTRIRKRLLRMGIDPVTHNPRLDLLDLSSILSSYHYNPSQMNMSRSLGTQPFVNPEVLKLVTSLLSSSRQNQNQKSNLLQQNVQENQLCNPQIQNQYQDLAQPSQIDVHTIQEMKNCVSFNNHDQAELMEPKDDIEQYPSSTFANFSSQNSQLNDWLQSNEEVPFNLLNEDYAPLNYDYYNGSEEIVTDPRSFHTNNDNQNFGFVSVFSTKSSSPDPMNSNSTYVNGSVTEDEKESYCSNRLKFDVPKIFDVNDFL